MNISQTYDQLGQRLEIRIVIDAYDLKAAKPEDLRLQLRKHLRAECAEVIQDMIQQAKETEKPPA